MQHETESWKKLWEEHLGRMTAAGEQVTRIETQWMENAQAAVDQSASLTRQALTYSAQLSAEFRKLALEAARRTTDLLSFRS